MDWLIGGSRRMIKQLFMLESNVNDLFAQAIFSATAAAPPAYLLSRLFDWLDQDDIKLDAFKCRFVRIGN